MLNVKRTSTYVDKFRAYDIVVNEKSIGQISDGETKSFYIEPGDSTIYVKLSWARSKKLHFKYEKDTDVSFLCSSNLKGGRAFLAVIYAIFLPHKYLKIEQL